MESAQPATLVKNNSTTKENSCKYIHNVLEPPLYLEKCEERPTDLIVWNSRSLKNVIPFFGRAGCYE